MTSQPTNRFLRPGLHLYHYFMDPIRSMSGSASMLEMFDTYNQNVYLRQVYVRLSTGQVDQLEDRYIGIVEVASSNLALSTIPYSIKSDPQRLHYHRFLINIAIAFARITCKKTWFELFGPFSRPGHHFILRPCARMCAGLVFTASIVGRYCAMFSIGRCLQRRHEQNGFCNYFPDDSRRGVVR